MTEVSATNNREKHEGKDQPSEFHTAVGSAKTAFQEELLSSYAPMKVLGSTSAITSHITVSPLEGLEKPTLPHDLDFDVKGEQVPWRSETKSVTAEPSTDFNIGKFAYQFDRLNHDGKGMVLPSILGVRAIYTGSPQSRSIAIDLLEYDKVGDILPVKMTNTGVLASPIR